MIHSLDGRYIYQNHPACSKISQQRANLSQLETPLSHYIPPYPHPIPMANSYNILIFLWNSNVPSHCEMIQPISRWIIATRIYIYTSSLIIVFIIIFNYHFILLLFLVIVFLLLLLLLVFLFSFILYTGIIVTIIFLTIIIYTDALVFASILSHSMNYSIFPSFGSWGAGRISAFWGVWPPWVTSRTSCFLAICAKASAFFWVALNFSKWIWSTLHSWIDSS